MHSRIFLLNRLGDERENPFEEKFGNVPASDGSDYPTMTELRSAWDALAVDLADALQSVTEEKLDETLEDGWHPDQAMRDQVVFLAWHEGYHVGAIGQIRKRLGLPGPAERVMEARAGEDTGTST